VNPFFQQLKQAREAKGISLAQISDITRIAENYLDAIEEGNISILPQAYVRAFVREYASVVGLDPDKTMRLYDDVAPGTSTAPAVPPPAAEVTTPVADRTVHGTGLAPEKTLMTPTTMKIALGLLATAVLAIIIWNMTGREHTPPAEEIPFQNIIKEQERRLSPTQAPLPAVSAAVPAGSATDSLTLKAVTTDSVWIMVIIDHGEPREYLLPAGAKVSWRGRERFAVTLGNAGAAEFTLNQKQLGPLGKKGSVLRGIELNRQTLSSR
jgi:cytoskeletal protein RodZ